MFIELLPEAFKWNPIFDDHCMTPSNLSPLNPGDGFLISPLLKFLLNSGLGRSTDNSYKIIILLENRSHILQISNSL